MILTIENEEYETIELQEKYIDYDIDCEINILNE